MEAYVELQEREFALEESGYTATRHQREVGAGYFDAVASAVSGGESSTLALTGSTEEAQFDKTRRRRHDDCGRADETGRRARGARRARGRRRDAASCQRGGCEVIVDTEDGGEVARLIDEWATGHGLPFMPVQVDGSSYALVPPAG